MRSYYLQQRVYFRSLYVDIPTHFDEDGDPTDEFGNEFTKGQPVADFLRDSLESFHPHWSDPFEMSPGYGWTGSGEYMGISWRLDYVVDKESSHIQFVRYGKWLFEERKNITRRELEFFQLIDRLLKSNQFVDSIYWKASRKDERRFASPEPMMAR